MNPSPKFCGECGEKLSPDVRFCEMCGNLVSEESKPKDAIKTIVSGRDAKPPAQISEQELKKLIQNLKDKDGNIRKESADSIVSLRTAAIDPLIQTLRDPDWDKDDEEWSFGVTFIDIFKRIGNSAVDQLIQALTDDVMLVRWIAGESLASIGDPRARDPIRHSLQDKDSFIREMALGWI